MEHAVEWRPVKGFEGRYLVSNMGVVKSIDRYRTRVRNGVPQQCLYPGCILKPLPVNRSGHAQVALRDGKRERRKLVHRLVAEAFLSGYSEDVEVHHLDHDPTNNKLDNLVVIDRERHVELHRLARSITMALYKALTPLDPRALRRADPHQIAALLARYLEENASGDSIEE